MITRSTTILVEDFHLPALIGIYPEEQKTLQPITVTVGMLLGTSTLAHDTIEETVSYEDVVREIRRLAQVHHNLVETLAEHIARFALCDKRVVEVNVKVTKDAAFTEGKVGCTLRCTQ